MVARSSSLEADVTDLTLDKRFDLVIVALNAVLLLDGRDAQRDLFRVIAAHLAADGRAVSTSGCRRRTTSRCTTGGSCSTGSRRIRYRRQVAKQTAARYESAPRGRRM